MMSHPSRFQIYAYYLLSVLVLSIFAFRGSADYDKYPKYLVILLIALPYVVSAVARAVLEPRVVLSVAPLYRSRRQLYLDLSLFVFIAAVYLACELLVHRLPAFVALKSGIWVLVIGYFASIDSALHRVRTTADRDTDSAESVDMALPVSQKLSIFLSNTVLLIVGTMAISAYGYINVGAVATTTRGGDVEQEFIVETLFILGIITALTTRIIVSYSANLQRMFETQTETLRNVQEGKLDRHVPVLTRDEFGVIAQQTNLIIDELREKNRIQKTLEQVVSPNIMERLLAASDGKATQAQEFDLAILFCDLREFTTYAEDKPPDEVIMFLNAYFTKLADVIAEHNGIVNKFIGDAILAVFGVDGDKDYAKHAVEAALDIIMHSTSAVMRDGTRFDIGIGINCGRAAAGTIGSSERFEYTFIGDSVNVASRLDGLSKRLGYRIVTSAKVQDLIPEHHKAMFTDLGDHNIRGKSQAVHLYGAMPEGENPESATIVQFSKAVRQTPV
ncbi:MAG: adenylate/guanylate cyclase domain-containing protein [Thiogranum sp.]